MNLRVFFFSFERAVEMLVGRVCRSIDLYETGGGSETVRDRLQLLTKLDIVSDVDLWLTMREVWNKIAHEYLAEQVAAIYTLLIKTYPPEIKRCGDQLRDYLQTVKT